MAYDIGVASDPFSANEDARALENASGCEWHER